MSVFHSIQVLMYTAGILNMYLIHTDHDAWNESDEDN